MRREGPLRTRSSPREPPPSWRQSTGHCTWMPASDLGSSVRSPISRSGRALPCQHAFAAWPDPRRTTSCSPTHRHGGLGPARHVPRRIDPPCHGRCDLAPDRRVLLPPGHCPRVVALAHRAQRRPHRRRAPQRADRPARRSPGRPHDGSCSSTGTTSSGLSTSRCWRFLTPTTWTVTLRLLRRFAERAASSCSCRGPRCPRTRGAG